MSGVQCTGDNFYPLLSSEAFRPGFMIRSWKGQKLGSPTLDIHHWNRSSSSQVALCRVGADIRNSANDSLAIPTLKPEVVLQRGKRYKRAHPCPTLSMFPQQEQQNEVLSFVLFFFSFLFHFLKIK